MKHQGMRRSAKVFFSCILLSLSLGACAAEDLQPTSSEASEISAAPVDEPAAVQAPEAQAASCCSFGYYHCSTNLEADADYDPPGCGMYTRPRAASVCRAACGHACVDSGWLDACN
jgi:hypothetical protein